MNRAAFQEIENEIPSRSADSNARRDRLQLFQSRPVARSMSMWVSILQDRSSRKRAQTFPNTLLISTLYSTYLYIYTCLVVLYRYKRGYYIVISGTYEQANSFDFSCTSQQARDDLFALRAKNTPVGIGGAHKTVERAFWSRLVGMRLKQFHGSVLSLHACQSIPLL